jgi:hypothetical protein
MKAVQLDTRPLARNAPDKTAQACSALLALSKPQNTTTNALSWVATPPAALSIPSSQDSSITTVDNCPSCDSPLLWGECMECSSNHTCQRGQHDCYPCQLALLEARVSSQLLPAEDEDPKPSDQSNEFPWHLVPRHEDSQASLPRTPSLCRSLSDASGHPPSPRQATPSPSPSASSERFLSQVPYRHTSQITPLPPTSPTDQAVLQELEHQTQNVRRERGQWLDPKLASPTRQMRTRYRDTTPIPSSSPRTFTWTNSRASVYQVNGLPRVNHVGFVDTSFSRSVNPGLTGHLGSLYLLSNLLAENTTLDGSVMLMADIISIVSSTSNGSSTSKTNTDSALVHDEDLLLGTSNSPVCVRALDELMQIYCEFRVHPSTLGITSRSMATLPLPTSIGHLCGDLTRLATIITRDLSLPKQKLRFLTTLRTILREISWCSEPISEEAPMKSTEKQETFPRPRKIRRGEFESTGTDTPQSESGSSSSSPTPSPSFKRQRRQGRTLNTISRKT